MWIWMQFISQFICPVSLLNGLFYLEINKFNQDSEVYWQK